MSKHDDEKMREAAFGAVRLVSQTAIRPATAYTPVAHVAIPAPIAQPTIQAVPHVQVPSYSPSPTAAMIQPYAMGSGNITSQPPAESVAVTAFKRSFTVARLGSSAAVPVAHQMPAALNAHPADLASTAFRTPAQKAAAAAIVKQQIALGDNSATAAPNSMAPNASTAVDGGAFPDGGAEPSYQDATDAGWPDQSADSPPPDDGSLSVDWTALDDGNAGASNLASLTASAVPGLKPNSAIQAAIAPIAVKPSFWSKLLALFGFGPKTPAVATVHGEDGKLQSMVESIVRRARSGDQNAMALIAMVRDNAKAGHPKAQESFALLQEYVRTNPVAEMGVDYVAITQAPGTQWAGDPTYSDAVALSHGPLLTNPRIGKLLSRFGGEDRSAIRFGIENRHSMRGTAHGGVRMGHILAHARRLQAVRMPHSSLTNFDKRVGWELGERKR